MGRVRPKEERQLPKLHGCLGGGSGSEFDTVHSDPVSSTRAGQLGVL